MSGGRTSGAEPPRESVTAADASRRLGRDRLWWWAGVLFLAGGAVSLAVFALAMRELLPTTALAGMGIVLVFALQRLLLLLRRRPT